MILSYIEQLLSNSGLSESASTHTANGLYVTTIILIAFLLYNLLRNPMLKIIREHTEKTSNQWDDILMGQGVFHRLLKLIPVTFVVICIDRTMPDNFVMLKRIIFATLIIMTARIIESFLNSITKIYQAKQTKHQKPIQPLIQSLIIVLYLTSGIFLISVLLNKEPWHLFGLLGGLTAVTMLVFKDTILGFVAGIQLGANDMIRVGDWIEMPKYGADGDVIEITINTIKVRNWDKTISTIPTYALISDSFKNWRGMSESGGRRIKRHICIDMNTVQFVDEELLAKFQKMAILKDFIEQKQQEIKQANERDGLDLSATKVNGRHQTNLGIFRAYLLAYLHNNPKIHKDMTFIVRQLQPTEKGIPMEVYVFSNDQNWSNFEGIQADIFDHILAALPEFKLRAFQEPSGKDIAMLASHQA